MSKRLRQGLERRSKKRLNFSDGQPKLEKMAQKGFMFSKKVKHSDMVDTVSTRFKIKPFQRPAWVWTWFHGFFLIPLYKENFSHV